MAKGRCPPLPPPFPPPPFPSARLRKSYMRTRPGPDSSASVSHWPSSAATAATSAACFQPRGAASAWLPSVGRTWKEREGDCGR